MRPLTTTILATSLALMLSGCAVDQCGCERSQVGGDLQLRMGTTFGPDTCPGELLLPPETALSDGLTDEEAVSIALWNSPEFNATLSGLGIARGDLVQAGLLTNPQYVHLFPGGAKQLEYVLFLPIESLLLQGQRVSIAEKDLCRVSQELVQNGLNLARDVRIAYADLVFAIDRAALAEESLDVRNRIAGLSDKRLAAGDISELEAMTARIDAQRARSEAAGMRHEVTIAQDRLKRLMGISTLPDELIPVAVLPATPADFDVDALVAEAVNSRPDLRAARIAVEAACERNELADLAWLRLDGVFDGNSGGAGPSNVGPGIRADIPIFNRNEGGRIRSSWTLQQAQHNYFAVRDRIVMEVRNAEAQRRQASDILAILQSDVLPSISETLTLAERAYQQGGTAYFLVLQTSTQLLDSRARELELAASLRRAHAELERSIGRRLIPPTEANPEPPPVPLLEITPVAGSEHYSATPASQAPQVIVLTLDSEQITASPEERKSLSDSLRLAADRLDAMPLSAPEQSAADGKHGWSWSGQKNTNH